MSDLASLGEILFIDIETIPGYPSWDAVPEDVRELWTEKSAYYRERHGLGLEESFERAGIYAEFGQVICIGLGYFIRREGHWHFRVTDFSGHEERKLLSDLASFLDRTAGHPFRALCAHNGKEFDFPYLCRRMLANRVGLPGLLRLAGRKPWEVPHLDTMELWKFGDYKHYTSLKLLARVLDVPGSKGDMDGSRVAEVYREPEGLARIARYCRADVVSLARVYQRMNGLEPVDDSAVEEA